MLSCETNGNVYRPCSLCPYTLFAGTDPKGYSQDKEGSTGAAENDQLVAAAVPARRRQGSDQAGQFTITSRCCCCCCALYTRTVRCCTLTPSSHSTMHLALLALTHYTVPVVLRLPHTFSCTPRSLPSPFSGTGVGFVPSQPCHSLCSGRVSSPALFF